jgi:hypothetical protein
MNDLKGTEALLAKPHKLIYLNNVGWRGRKRLSESLL